jgi:protein-tyrosine kinase
MSRIHDALKKAAQERSAQISAIGGPDSVDVAIETQRTAVHTTEASRREVPGVATAEETRDLSFQELIKRRPRSIWHPGPQTGIFVNNANGREGAEEFRTLRSRLYQIAAVQPLRRVLVTSSVPEEGKTFVSTNLAHSIARQPDKRVLLIDADLRASRIHQILGAPKTPGLTDYLRGDADEYAIIQHGPEGNLCFIPGGNEVPNPSELLLNERMKKLLESITPIFEWVILDSPPAIPVHDASTVADLCDGVLLVVRAGVTSFEMAEKAASEFRQKNLLGVVLNRVAKSDSYGGYYYGYPAVRKEKEST